MKYQEKSDFEMDITYKGKSFIYFLLNHEREVVYVGKTTTGFARPFRHDTKEFDIICIVDCKKENLDIIEDKYIKYYKPFYNVTGNPDKADYIKSWKKGIKKTKPINNTTYLDDSYNIEPFMTKDEISEKLKIKPSTLKKLLSDGMPKVKVRGQIRFIYDEVEQWLKAGDNIGRKANVRKDDNR